jgi:hypothetical protein
MVWSYVSKQLYSKTRISNVIYIMKLELVTPNVSSFLDWKSHWRLVLTSIPHHLIKNLMDYANLVFKARWFVAFIEKQHRIVFASYTPQSVWPNKISIRKEIRRIEVKVLHPDWEQLSNDLDLHQIECDMVSQIHFHNHIIEYVRK